MDTSAAVADRYSRVARETEGALCCPVNYDPRYLEVIPAEVVERDYGCGDPTRHIEPGDVVLDLGSGTGKACFIASQIVGPEGRVIGVDMTPDMLALARQHTGTVGERIGWHNVEFRRGHIEDLGLDLDRLDAWLAEHPVTDAAGYEALEAEKRRQRRDEPLVADASVNVVMSNCVLNLVDEARKPELFPEIYRVLRDGGRAVISDIVADEPVPEHLRADPELWSGCISGALTETEFLAGFERAGFYGIEILEWNRTPWRTVEGIEFRSMTVRARKGTEGPCLESNRAIVYLGPWKRVVDDDGHTFHRGRREAVCDKTFRLMNGAPYAGSFATVEPHQVLPESEWPPFDCTRTGPRHPRETKGEAYDVTTDAAGPACGPDGCC